MIFRSISKHLVHWTLVQFIEPNSIRKAPTGLGVSQFGSLLLRIKAGFHPIFACFNLIRRVHSQLINRSSPYRRSTQQLEPSSVEIKCSFHVSWRGLNSTISSRLSGSLPEM